MEKDAEEEDKKEEVEEKEEGETGDRQYVPSLHCEYRVF